MWKNVTESNDKIRKKVTRPEFFRRSEGSINAHFTQVCFFYISTSFISTFSSDNNASKSPKASQTVAVLSFG